MAYVWREPSIWHPKGCKCSQDPMCSGNGGCTGFGTWFSGPLNPTEYTEQLRIAEKQLLEKTLTWVYIFEEDTEHQLIFYRVLEVKYSIEMPEENEDRGGSWVVCSRKDVAPGWLLVDNVFMSPSAFERFRQRGPSYLPRQPRTQEFRIFNFFGMDNYATCRINIDIDNYTSGDLSKMLISYYKGAVDLGIKSNGGEPDGTSLKYRSIQRMVYTNFSTSNYIIEQLKNKGMNGLHYKELLWAAVTTSYLAKKVPENQKIPLTIQNKLISEYNIDPSSPIVAQWDLDPSPGQNYSEIAFNILTDIIF